MTADKQVIGDVQTVGETPYSYRGRDYKSKAVQTRSLGYVVEFYQDQQCYSYIVVPGSQLMN